MGRVKKGFHTIKALINAILLSPLKMKATNNPIKIPMPKRGVMAIKEPMAKLRAILLGVDLIERIVLRYLLVLVNMSFIKVIAT